ncbi:hypothetical protein Hanom_Chr09g00801161 [Helianthus anomalus]
MQEYIRVENSNYKFTKIYLSAYVGQAQFPTCLWFQHTNLMHKISHSSWLKY